ncbi:MAG: LapA family protein [Proteobacteria bacterium]|nr:LapA family protein [Pseudomonadota bacterium]MBU1547317.1 LapA family protein [Pseudomonadota bacterium]MBU2618629.1 LapA family protein [Pseudomonadota bacterium]
MKVRTLFLLIVLVAIAAFAALNWSAFMAPATLSLGVANIQAPLGLVMLGMTAFLVVLFLVFVVYLQTSLLFDTRRNARELQACHELADQAEASRFTELRGFLEEALKKQADADDEARAAMMARLDQLDRDLRSAIEESGTTLSAYIGELEDRLERTKG